MGNIIIGIDDEENIIGCNVKKALDILTNDPIYYSSAKNQNT
jgi:predicted HTH transcriptional regulator